MLGLSLAILTVGYAAYAFVHVPWQGFVVAAVSGIGVGGFWPAQSTLIAGLTPTAQRPAAFAMQRVVMNLGFGLGALTGGLIAAADTPRSFEALFLLDAVSLSRLRDRDGRARTVAHAVRAGMNGEGRARTETSSAIARSSAWSC